MMFFTFKFKAVIFLLGLGTGGTNMYCMNKLINSYSIKETIFMLMFIDLLANASIGTIVAVNVFFLPGKISCKILMFFLNFSTLLSLLITAEIAFIR